MKQKLVAVALAGAFVLGACGGGNGGTPTGGAGGGNTAAPEVPSGDITYFGTEFAFEGPETIAAGETTMTLQNQGKQPHMLIMVELLEGKTIEDVSTFMEEEGLKGPPPSWVKEIKKFEAFAKPGKTATTKPTELTPGTYAMLCFITDKKSKKPHAMLGMLKEITVE